MIDILTDVVIKGFKIMIPITFFYGLFVYILLRDTKEIELQKNQIINNQPITITPYYLTYYRKPLHNKLKNNYITKKTKHKNRKDRQSIRQRRSWWKNYY